MVPEMIPELIVPNLEGCEVRVSSLPNINIWLMLLELL